MLKFIVDGAAKGKPGLACIGVAKGEFCECSLSMSALRSPMRLS